MHDQWDNRMVESLSRNLGPDYEIRYPRMPCEDDPQYQRWKPALMQELAQMDDGAILMRHSIGGTVLINVLVEERLDWTPDGIFLISVPFVGEGGWPSDEIRPMSDLGVKLISGVPIYLYHGSQDAMVPAEHLDLYQRAIPQAIVRRLAGSDHQLNNDLSDIAADIRKRIDTG